MDRLVSWTTDKNIARIVEFVRWYRASRSIKPYPGRKPEGSCFAFGEFNNLIYCQLINTPEYTDGWLALKNSPQVVEGTIRQIVFDLVMFRNRGETIDLPNWDEAFCQAVIRGDLTVLQEAGMS